MPLDDEIEVFATGTSVLVTDGVARPDAVAVDIAENTIPAATAPADVVPAGTPEPHRDFHARRGPRPGASPTPITGTRRGGADDIVRPVLMHPARAAELATDGTMFGEPVPHLAVDHRAVEAADRVQSRPLTWTARVDHGRRRPRPARLQLLASPSMVVTVIELVPTRRMRFGRERYLAEAIAAVEELAHRLECATRQTVRTAASPPAAAAAPTTTTTSTTTTSTTTTSTTTTSTTTTSTSTTPPARHRR